uniref:Uncharacterized protein n=1 Tax=Zea mays TaxID=4577 RepID=A0A804MRV7_MAIZE
MIYSKSNQQRNQEPYIHAVSSSSFLLGSRLGHLGSRRVLLLHALYHADRDRLPHVADREAPQRRILREGLHHHGLCGDHLDEAGVTVLEELGPALQLLPRPPVDLGEQLRELDGDVGRVAVQHGGVAVADLPRVVHDDHLRGEAGSLLGGVVLGVGGHVAALQVLHSHVLDVEADVVAGQRLLHRLVVHLHRLDLRRQPRGPKGDHHAGLQEASLHTAHRDGADAADLVHVLQGKAQGLVRGPLGLVDLVQRLEKGGTLVPVQQIICLTPRVKARSACSRVWPSLEIPASKPPVVESMMSTAQSAWEVPVIMFLMKSRCPGASITVQ